MRARTGLALTAGLLLGLASPSVPAAADQPGAPTYRANDYGTELNILPAGSNGLATAADIVSFEGNGARPPHSHDQYDAYQNLMYNLGGLNDAALGQYYKDASFGIAPGDLDTA